jgi:hypothetical protein
MVTGRSDSLWQKIFRAYQAKEYKPGHHRKIDSESQTTDLSTYIGATLGKNSSLKSQDFIVENLHGLTA